MIVGYARTSTVDQQAGLEAQLRELKAAGAEKVFQEQISSAAHRSQLKQCLDFVRDGDTLVVTKPDRLARSTAELLKIIDWLESEGARLIILSIGGQQIDTRNPTGKLMVTMLGAIGAFERDLMLERQREGIARAKAAGRYTGRKPTARAKAADVIRLAGEGVTREGIATRLGIGVASVYRILADQRAA
jgi:DNA invertase Pin-like site-specific DNA recombinase